MNIVAESELMKCPCGGRPRYRYSTPVHWVECRNKKCHMRTPYFPDVDGTFDIDSAYRAAAEWNRMVKEDGKT